MVQQLLRGINYDSYFSCGADDQTTSSYSQDYSFTYTHNTNKR